MPRMSENERNDIKSSILEIMSASMTRLHISKAELAEKCGITKSTMYARWQNPGTFQVDELLSIANVCNIPIWVLCSGKRVYDCES